MSLNTITSAQLLPAAIVAIGQDAAAIAAAAAPHYPATVTAVDVVDAESALDIAVELLTSLAASATDSGVGSGLPAVVVLANTSQAGSVLELLRALRAQATTLRPRVWPTFVAGDPTSLSEFDAGVDQLGTGSCDLVLMMTGTASSSEKAAALGAWLHVKMPAPPSVLGELPDIDGRICRYVAIGSGTVAPDASSAAPTVVAALAPVDVEQVTAAVRAKLAEVAAKAVSVTAANDAASALCAAAEDLDAAALLRAENNLANALSDVSRQLSKSLSDSLAGIIQDELSAPTTHDESTQSRAAGEEAAGSAAAEDRTAAVSQLVLLTSKGGLTKMLSRSRMAAVAQSISAAARRDVDDAVTRAVDQANHEVPDRIKAAIAARERQLIEQREAAELADAQLVDKVWREALVNCRKAVALWPHVSTAGIKRSWGGSVPAPRQYVVGSESALRAMPEDDEALSIIDLRERDEPVDARKIDLRDGVRGVNQRHATVLLAQYGLPLVAFDAS